MFRSLFYNCKNVYLKSLPTMVTFSGTSGLFTGIYNYTCDNNNDNDKNKHITINLYTYMIGYISIGILTGIMYPISFPLCAIIVYKER
jgi:hypothetical protein